MTISNELLENMLRHAEIKRDAACEMISDQHGASGEFSRTLGELELQFWTDLNEIFLELRAYRKAVSNPLPPKADT